MGFGNSEQNFGMIASKFTVAMWYTDRQVLRRIKSTALSLRSPLHSELTFPSFADAVCFIGLCNPA